MNTRIAPDGTRFNLWRAAAVVLATAWIVHANFVPYFDFGWPIRVENYHTTVIWWTYGLLNGLIAVAVIAFVYRIASLAFQNSRNHLRLSTLVVLMFMGGTVLWLNMKPHASDDLDVYWYGWPQYVWHTSRSGHGPSARADRLLLGAFGFFHNLLVAFSMLFGTACVFEFLVPQALNPRATLESGD